MSEKPLSELTLVDLLSVYDIYKVQSIRVSLHQQADTDAAFDQLVRIRAELARRDTERAALVTEHARLRDAMVKALEELDEETSPLMALKTLRDALKANAADR